ncbi:ATPase family associated with various cellular activities (AAA) [Planctomycetes bacterium CA13]|uniref:ATPase family associated with various cellular activities (AAA) n=1 Tax=Novipirellula herctigrandis TaxID=2527986 RepID=A0A5C5Z241_9BACT|nr:ATPase family associated with various cellular activities (AAA) [Planctomycetes bacterium CA13]
MSRDAILKASAQMNAQIIGQETVVERLLIALLANGNVLMEGLPGTAKTRSIKTLSKLVESQFRRVQFTPDLLPSDVTGSEIYREQTGDFEFQPGPLFGNLVLADEINRAPAKVQAALLEAMEERQVTVAGKTHKLPDLFLVLATQNPIEQEGTYPLPEAQMDRFLVYVQVPYPPAENELSILRLVRSENTGGGSTAPEPISQEAIFAARKEVDAVHVAESAEQYIVDLVIASREPNRFGDELAKWIRIGASPRGTIALDAAARARAWLKGNDFVSPEDIQAVAPACLAHRIHLSYEAEAAGKTRENVVDAILEKVAVA